MKNTFIDQKIFNRIEIPVQKFMELNIRTLQGFSYLKPFDLLSFKKPEEFLEKNVDIFIQNGHIALNYVRDTFNLLEDHVLNVSRGFDESAQVITQGLSEIKKTVKKVASSGKNSVLKKSVSSVKTGTKKNTKVLHTTTTSKQKLINSGKQGVKGITAKTKTGIPTKETTVDRGISKVGGITEKDGIGLHNLNKGHNFPN